MSVKKVLINVQPMLHLKNRNSYLYYNLRKSLTIHSNIIIKYKTLMQNLPYLKLNVESLNQNYDENIFILESQTFIESKLPTAYQKLFQRMQGNLKSCN